MIPRSGIYEKYWYFAAERQAIFFKKLGGEPGSWTDDSILQEYKFCNVYRASDRVSQYLIKEVIYRGSTEPREVIFRILLFKLFNKIDTWQYLLQQLGAITLKDFDLAHYGKLLQEAKGKGQAIYHNAYMSCANKAFGYDSKHMNHLALIEKMLLIDALAEKILAARSFEQVFLLLREYPLIGDFMAYQLATDINYSEVINFSEQDFTVVGPGSQRGIHKCFKDLEGKSYEYVIAWMQANQEKEFERLGLNFQSLWGRPIQLIDAQGLFCETDKYCRVAAPELKSNRKKIKAKYAPKPEFIRFFYPPKWQINEFIPTND